jgi:presenilin-like A22 family membrane protease
MSERDAVDGAEAGTDESGPTAEGAAGTGAAGRLAGLAPQAGIGLCYVATVLGGMALAGPAGDAGIAAFENPGSVGNVGVFALYVLLGTAVMLAAFRYGKGQELVRLFLVLVFSAMAANAVLLATGVGGVVDASSAFGGLPATPLGGVLVAGFAAALWLYPEWWVIDVVGVLGGAVVIPMFGLGFSPLPLVVLLVAWAAYDAYAVYGSGHMKELASGVGTLKVPVVFVVPTERGASFRDAEFPDLAAEDAAGAAADGAEDAAGEAADGAEDATGEAAADGAGQAVSASGDGGGEADGDDPVPVTLLGLGDAIIPGMLAVSAGNFLTDAPTLVPALNANAPALGALVGGVAGLVALGYLARRFEGVHAGLPPLNAGVLGGYFIGTLAAGLPLTAALGL